MAKNKNLPVNRRKGNAGKTWHVLIIKARYLNQYKYFEKFVLTFCNSCGQRGRLCQLTHASFSSLMLGYKGGVHELLVCNAHD